MVIGLLPSNIGQLLELSKAGLALSQRNHTIALRLAPQKCLTTISSGLYSCRECFFKLKKAVSALTLTEYTSPMVSK